MDLLTLLLLKEYTKVLLNPHNTTLKNMYSSSENL